MDATIVNFGVDSLWLNFCYKDAQGLPDKQPSPQELLDILTGYQEQAKVLDEPVETPYAFNEHPLLMYPHGGGARSPWRFLLRNDDLELKVGTGKKTGFVAKVRLMASYLWPIQYAEDGSLLDAVTAAWVCVSALFNADLFTQVAEVHLCADMTHDFSDANWQEGFIRRCGLVPHFDREMRFVEEDTQEDASYLVGPDKLHLRYRAITGYTFGTRSSALHAVVYDKKHYIETKEPASDYFHVLWQRNGWDGEAPVWRAEFRLTRDLLRDVKIADVCHGIDDAFDLPDYLQVLWHYCTIHYLRYVVPSDDTNRARWEAHPAWQVLQSAFFPQVNVSLAPVVRERKRVVNMKQIIAQIIGCSMTLHAWVKDDQPCESEDLSMVLHYLYPAGLSYLEQRDKEFNAIVRKKQHQYHLLKAVA